MEIKIEDQRPKQEWSICSHLVSLNGASHWVVAEDGLKNIVAFNLATEKIQVFTTPLQTSNYCLTWLEVLEGHLCFIVIARGMFNDVWLMKEFGEGGYWTLDL